MGDFVSPDEYGGYFSQLEKQYNLPSGYLARTGEIESSAGNGAIDPNATNGNMKGAFQFSPDTAKQYNLTNPFDWKASAEAAAQLASDNKGILASALQRDPSAGELYLAHQQGAGGATNMLSDPTSKAVDTLGAKEVTGNGGSPDMTNADFAKKWTEKFDNSQAPSGPPVAYPTPSVGMMAANGNAMPSLAYSPPGGVTLNSTATPPAATLGATPATPPSTLDKLNTLLGSPALAAAAKGMSPSTTQQSGQPSQAPNMLNDPNSMMQQQLAMQIMAKRKSRGAA